MAKNDASKPTDTAETAAPVSTEPRPLPALGTVAMVRTAPGQLLINNETNAYFEPEVDTPVTITPTTLRRLMDGDLALGG